MRETATPLAAWSATAVVLAGALWMLIDVLWRGAPGLSLEFLLETPRDAGRAGGVAPILLSTVWILVVALAAALPLGLATAIWLSESTLQRPRLQRAVRLSLDMLAGVPSIVFGLFGNAVFAVALGMGLSILSGGLTLACMALPIIIRTAEEGLRALPAELRLQAAALGLRRSRIVLGLLLPAALPALLAGTLLGIGRALAETAALIFTSGYVDRAPQSWLDSGRALSVHIYDLSMNVPGGERNAYTSALVLMALILGINAATHAAARQWRHALRWQDPATIDR